MEHMTRINQIFPGESRGPADVIHLGEPLEQRAVPCQLASCVAGDGPYRRSIPPSTLQRTPRDWPENSWGRIHSWAEAEA